MLSLFVITLGLAYAIFLGVAANRARKINAGDATEKAFAKSGMPTWLLWLSFSATLFSTFTLLGVPNFFRTHGVATWLFIGVTDVAMGFVVLWFGLHFRRFLRTNKLHSLTQVLRVRYRTNLAYLVYIAGIFIFLAPYVAIQIKGVSGLFSVLSGLDTWLWSVIVLATIVVYSWVGGMRAIVYSDVVQGLILIIVIWLVGFAVINEFGGLTALFDTVRAEKPELLTAPGPVGLMSWQYILASFIAILWMPATQPQLLTRLAATKSEREIPLMALGISCFAFVILLPTIVIGLGGAILYAGLTPNEFFATALVSDRAPLIGALAIVGLLAAAMSTADSQLHSLSTEIDVALTPPGKSLKAKRTSLLVAVFAVLSFAVSFLEAREIVSLARVSFAGTAIIGPMIILSVSSVRVPSIICPLISLAALCIFLLSVLTVIPNQFGGVRLDLILFATTGAAALIEWGLKREPGKAAVS